MAGVISGIVGESLPCTDERESAETELGMHSAQRRALRREVFVEKYTASTGDAAVANWYVDMFEKLATVSPIPVVSNHDFAWWINFSLKWQTVHMRLLMFVDPDRASSPR